MSERNEFTCAARGCDGCFVCEPNQPQKYSQMVITEVTDARRIQYLLEENARLREALQLIATPKRPDGTYNRSRDACEQLARDALEGK